MGHVLKLLMANGAREAHYMPIYTKKNRPAYTLTVICKEDGQRKSGKPDFCRDDNNWYPQRKNAAYDPEKRALYI